MYVVQPTIRTGDKPGPGVWRCLACNWRVEVKDNRTPLPPCGGECAEDPKAHAAQARYARIRGIVLGRK